MVAVSPDKSHQPKRHRSRLGCWLRFVAIAFTIGLSCAIVTGVLIGHFLEDSLTEIFTRDTSVTPLPQIMSLQEVRSLEMRFTFRFAESGIVSAGDVIVSRVGDYTNVYLALRSTILLNPIRVMQVQNMAYIYEDNWHPLTSDRWESQFFTMASRLADIIPNGLRLNPEMTNWHKVGMVTRNGRWVTIYERSYQFPAAEQLLSLIGVSTQDGRMTVELGDIDRLPYKFIYDLPFIFEGSSDKVRVEVEFFGYNQPINLALPTFIP